MEEIKLSEYKVTDKTIMVFAEGTVLKPKSWLSIYNHNSYVPIGNSVLITRSWAEQGANIIYCTSRRGKKAQVIAEILKKYGFAGTKLIFRNKRETYTVLVESIQPDILIEDDCKSIGGAWQMCITKVQPVIKENILSIVVKEFDGIDDLPICVSDFGN